MPNRIRLIVVAVAAVVLAAPAVPQAQPDLVARARAIHDRVITLDTHNDIDPQNFTADCNYTMRLTTQVNLPKMKEGGLDVSFFIAYVGQGELTPSGYDAAYRAAIAKFDYAGYLGEQGVVLAPPDVIARFEPRAPLTYDDRSTGDQLSSEDFDTEPLRVGIAPVFGTA